MVFLYSTDHLKQCFGAFLGWIELRAYEPLRLWFFLNLFGSGSGSRLKLFFVISLTIFFIGCKKSTLGKFSAGTAILIQSYTRTTAIVCCCRKIAAAAVSVYTHMHAVLLICMRISPTTLPTHAQCVWVCVSNPALCNTVHPPLYTGNVYTLLENNFMIV